ncbi:MAG: hypothetical protein SGJ11_11595 [Phycisphaerae bacterium]|nr:hypothetical protein [Phycisphaerae bacterium]
MTFASPSPSSDPPRDLPGADHGASPNDTRPDMLPDMPNDMPGQLDSQAPSDAVPEGVTGLAPAAPDAAPAVLEMATAFVPNSSMRHQRRNDGPRRIKNGLRFRRKEGLDNLSWPASAWLQRIDGRIEALLRAEAIDYAKAGQVASLVVMPGLVEAVVQGRAARPYRTRIEVQTLAPSEWDRVVAIMAAEAIWSAKLLSGELPVGVEVLFRSLGRTLVPERDDEISFSCTCTAVVDALNPNPGGPCKHVMTAWAMVMERLETDPLLSFTLRGLDGQRLLERLQEARAIATRGVSKAHSTPPLAESTPSLPPVERCLQDFWKPGRRMLEVDESPDEEHVPHALLRRLGPTPFQAGANRAMHAPPAPARGMPAPVPVTNSNAPPTSKFPLVGLLASIYDSIALAGRKLREAEDEPTGSSGGK